MSTELRLFLLFFGLLSLTFLSASRQSSASSLRDLAGEEAIRVPDIKKDVEFLAEKIDFDKIARSARLVFRTLMTAAGHPSLESVQ